MSLANFKKVLGYLSDRLGNKTIELEVEANGKKLKVKASSQKELNAAPVFQSMVQRERFNFHNQAIAQQMTFS
ncbi:MAG: hypothetical protein V7K32_14860 [Nostoc sp.]|uniref:hypothetical protein n=1 Tax=Nostoc sp. TaxID=1180 RepID=UPI002FFC3608